MTARNDGRRTVRRNFERAFLVAMSVAVGAGLALLYDAWSGPGSPERAGPVAAEEAESASAPADLEALSRELERRQQEIAELREHVRGFEWGIENLQRNIARIEFSISRLERGQDLVGAPFDIRGGSREEQLRRLGEIRVDLEDQIGRAGQTIERFESEVRDHETAIERLAGSLAGKTARP